MKKINVAKKFMKVMESAVDESTINEDKFSDSCNAILTYFKKLDPEREKIEVIINNLKSGGFNVMTSNQYVGIMHEIIDHLDRMDDVLTDVRKTVISDSMSFDNSGYKK